MLKPEVAFDEADTSAAYQRTIQVWILRILIYLKAYRQVGVAFNVEANVLASVLELESEPGETPEDTMALASISTRGC